MPTIQCTLEDYFKDTEEFTTQEAYDALKTELGLNVEKHSIRARIYEALKDQKIFRKSRAVYSFSNDNCECLLINGNGRDLSMIADNTIDAIITDHPYDLVNNKGGNRNFSDTYDCFKYTEQDFKEKSRVLKKGAFLVEFLPEESGGNWEYLSSIKKMATDNGFQYYAKVSWIKGNQVNNTGRKASNCEDLLFFSKGKARDLRLDTKKNISELEKLGISCRGLSSNQIKEMLESNNLPVHFMSGTNNMLPTSFIVEPPKKADRIHQSQKPKELYKLIEQYITKDFEWILDQFGGSCILGEATLENSRNSIVFEINQDIYNDAIKMYEKNGKPIKNFYVREER